MALAGTIEALKHRARLTGALSHINDHGRCSAVAAALEHFDQGESISERGWVRRNNQTGQLGGGNHMQTHRLQARSRIDDDRVVAALKLVKRSSNRQTAQLRQ